MARFTQQEPTPRDQAAVIRLPITKEPSWSQLAVSPSASTTTTVGAPKKGSTPGLPQISALRADI